MGGGVMRNALRFINKCREMGDIRAVLYMIYGWSGMSKQKKIDTINTFDPERDDNVENGFTKTYQIFKDQIHHFDWDLFEWLYTFWVRMSPEDRRRSYGMFYNNGNRKYTHRRYKFEEYWMFSYELADKDIDLRTPDSDAKQFCFKCRDCGYTTFGSYNLEACGVCGSINIYGASRSLFSNQVLGQGFLGTKYEWIYTGNYHEGCEDPQD